MPWMIRTLLTICAVAFPLYLYVGFRLAGSIGSLFPLLGSRARLIIVLVIAWLYILPVGTFLLYSLGTSTAPLFAGKDMNWADYLFHFPVWIGLVVVLELTAPFLIIDIVSLLTRLLPAITEKARVVLAYGRIVLVALAILYVTIRVVMDTVWVRDSVDRVAIQGLPPELAGLSITLVGDIQVDRYTGESKVRQVRRIIEEHKPALLMSSGDLVTSGRAFLGEAKDAVCGLHGSLATIAVMGDHDIWSAPEAIRAIYERCDWAFLDNEHRTYSYRGKSILVTGLTHIYSDRLSTPALERFLATASRADLKILLVHQPAEQVIRLAIEHGYQLVLAGHTHGGQIVLHPLGIPLTPSMRETRYYGGVYTASSTVVVVTQGVGMTLAPIRYHAPAQVTTLVLEKNDRSF